MTVGAESNAVSILGAFERTSVVPEQAVRAARLPLVDAVRALAAIVILGHHFSSYPPLAEAAMPIAGPLITSLHEYGRVAQVFIVVSGFILASNMSHRRWDRERASRVIVQRYCRLAVPYLGAIGLAMAASAFARDWIDDYVVGDFPTVAQLLAHVVFLQDLLGYESLSAGLWFVCISFQLTIMYVAGLVMRDALAERVPNWIRTQLLSLPIALGWVLAGASLFYFNRDSSWESYAVFFFGQFFLGVLVHRALVNPREQKWLAIYIAIAAAALLLEWRARLALALATGFVLFIGGKAGILSRWPTNPVVAFLGRISYSLFLIHFPVLIVVNAYWVQQDWLSPAAAIMGLAVAFALSLIAATLFYRFVEEPAARLSRRIA